MSKLVFMDYGCNLFDVIIAHFVPVFVSIKREILEVRFMSLSLIRLQCLKWASTRWYLVTEYLQFA